MPRTRQLKNRPSGEGVGLSGVTSMYSGTKLGSPKSQCGSTGWVPTRSTSQVTVSLAEPPCSRQTAVRLGAGQELHGAAGGAVGQLGGPAEHVGVRAARGGGRQPQGGAAAGGQLGRDGVQPGPAWSAVGQPGQRRGRLGRGRRGLLVLAAGGGRGGGVGGSQRLGHEGALSLAAR